MTNIRFLGVALLVLGILIIIVYGLYHFAVAEDISLVIRTGAIVILAGLVIVLLSLVRERLGDIKKEKEYKEK